MKNWFSLLRHKTQRFWQQPAERRMALLEAFLGLGLARACVLLLPFRWIAPHLGQLNQEPSLSCSPTEDTVSRQVVWAIAVTSRYTPWQSNCLAQAITGKMMLRRRRIGSTLYLGLQRQSDQMEAHAWLKVEERWVTGKMEATSSPFQVIASFKE